MKQNYYGTINGQGVGVVYENWYEDRQKALADLRREAKKLARQSFDGCFYVYYTVCFGGRIAASGDIPVRGLGSMRKTNPACAWRGNGDAALQGARLC
jgi:hypothetical protein